MYFSSLAHVVATAGRKAVGRAGGPRAPAPRRRCWTRSVGCWRTNRAPRHAPALALSTLQGWELPGVSSGSFLLEAERGGVAPTCACRHFFYFGRLRGPSTVPNIPFGPFNLNGRRAADGSAAPVRAVQFEWPEREVQYVQPYVRADFVLSRTARTGGCPSGMFDLSWRFRILSGDFEAPSRKYSACGCRRLTHVLCDACRGNPVRIMFGRSVHCLYRDAIEHINRSGNLLVRHLAVEMPVCMRVRVPVCSPRSCRRAKSPMIVLQRIRRARLSCSARCRIFHTCASAPACAAASLPRAISEPHIAMCLCWAPWSTANPSKHWLAGHGAKVWGRVSFASAGGPWTVQGREAPTNTGFVASAEGWAALRPRAFRCRGS